MAKARQYDDQFTNALGLKESDALSKKPPGSVITIKNMRYDDRGGRKSRPGYEKAFYIDEATQVTGLFDYTQSNGTQEILISTESKKIKKRTAGGVISDLMTGLNSDAPWTWINFLDRAFGCNGDATDYYRVYDGTTIFKLGIRKPANTPVLSLQAGGSLTAGTYKFYYTFYNDEEGWESNPYGLGSAAPAITTAGGNLTARITLLDKSDADDKVTHYRIYRTTAGGITLYRTAELVYATYQPSGGTGYYDDTGDPDGATELEYDNDPPVGGAPRLVEWQGQLYAVMNDSDIGPILAYSKTGLKPHAWPPEYYLPLPEDGSSAIWCASTRIGVLTYTGRTVGQLTGSPLNSTAYVRKIADKGLANTFCSVDKDQFISYLSRSGIYAQKPTEQSDVDLRADFIGKDIATTSSGINFAQSSIIRTHQYETDLMKHLYWAVPTGSSTENDTILVFDFRIGQWSVFEFKNNVTCWATIYDGQKDSVYFGDKGGYVWKFDVGLCDGYNGTATQMNGTATSGTTTTITDTAQSWSVDAFQGMYVTVLEGTNEGETKLISANTATEITCAAFTDPIDTTSVYSIGAIDKYCEEFWNSVEKRHLMKRILWAKIFLDEETRCTVDVSARADMGTKSLGSQEMDLFGTGVVFPLTFPMTFGGAKVGMKRLRFSGKFHFAAMKFRNQRAGDYFGLDGYSMCYKDLYDRTQ